jgi:hypothetical protein
MRIFWNTGARFSAAPSYTWAKQLSLKVSAPGPPLCCWSVFELSDPMPRSEQCRIMRTQIEGTAGPSIFGNRLIE